MEISFDIPTTPINSEYFKNMKYIGTLFGSVNNGEPVSKEETVQKLTKIKSLDELTLILSSIVGGIWIIIEEKDKLLFLSTTSAPSLYFYKKNNILYFTFYETEVYKLAIQKEKINPYEVYERLDNTPSSFHTHTSTGIPYSCLFQNIQRIPGAHVLEVDKDLRLSYQGYLYQNLKKLPIRANYKNFKKVLEAIAKLYVDSGKKIILYYSGGIDSYIIYLALCKYSDKVQIISTSQDFDGSFDGDRMHEVSQITKDIFGINTELIYADRFSKTQRDIRDDMCKLTSFGAAKWDSFLFYSVMERFKDEKNCMFLNGAEFEGYGITCTKMFISIPEFLSAPLQRYFFTWLYQWHMHGPINKRLWKRFIKNTGLDPSIGYFSSIVHMKPIPKDPFFKKYNQYKEDSFLKCTFPEKKQFKDIEEKDINKRLKTIRHYKVVPACVRVVFPFDIPSKSYTGLIAVEAPMVGFFCNLQAGVRDLFLPKRFMYKYFKEKTGKNHFIYYNPWRIARYTPAAHEKIRGNHIKIRKASADKHMFSDVFRNDFFKKIDLDNSVVLKYLDDPFMKKFVQEHYNDAKRGLLSFDEIQDIYNLEIFLKNLET